MFRPTGAASLLALRVPDLPRWRAITHVLTQAVWDNRPASTSSGPEQDVHYLERYVHYCVVDLYSCPYISLLYCICYSQREDSSFPLMCSYKLPVVKSTILC